jgi:hypothetical protein
MSYEDKVIGQVACQKDNDDLWVGWSLVPKLCGAGNGTSFIRRSVAEIRRIIDHPGAIYLRVAAWNKRAISAYKKAGFAYCETIIDEIAGTNKPEEFHVMKSPGQCYCGHDCSRCLVYLSTINDDAAMREESFQFYNGKIPLEKIRCMGGRSDDIFEACLECPFMKCCEERGYYSCKECPEYPCETLAPFIEKNVNKVLQVK